MSITVRLPDEVAERVRAVAADRGVSVDEVVVAAVRTQLSLEELDAQAADDEAHEALEAFLGCGASGDGRPFDIHEARRELAERKYAEDLAKRNPEGV